MNTGIGGSTCERNRGIDIRFTVGTARIVRGFAHYVRTSCKMNHARDAVERTGEIIDICLGEIERDRLIA